ncbi:MAG: glycerol kinase, partial [Microthrixaceae bacterium]|nr:glycerol kinase [Microthrixaceae bacterium]
MTYILAIDQGTTSSRAILFGAAMEVLGIAQREFAQIYPDAGWVEHDPEEIWTSTLQVCREVLERCGVSEGALAGIGITNQRETTVIWERDSGRALHNAIVWQDRRTAPLCAALREAGHEPNIAARTGL